MKSKLFCLPNLATAEVFTLEDPSEFKVEQAVLDLPKDDYKKRWFNPATKHCLFHAAEGFNPKFVVSRDNQAAALHGFAADYDGVFSPDLIEATTEKPPSKFKPTWWSLSQSKRLHLLWMFDRPITVTGNAHANALLRVIAAKIKAVRWGVGYDPECEAVLQPMDIGREWHEFSSSLVPVEEIIMWDAALLQKEAKNVIEDVVDIPFDVVAAEIKKRKWPHELPDTIAIGTRCVRFWAPDADNSTAAQFTKDGVRVYTPHDNGFKSWKSLLGAEFCEEYTAKSMAPFYEDTVYCHTKDEYWRFFRTGQNPHFEKRTEKVLRRDLVTEARRSPKPPKGGVQSEVDVDLYTISHRNSVDAVAHVLYRPAGRIRVDGIGSVLNTSLVAVKKPVERLATVTPEDLDRVPDLKKEYRENPGLCAWDNPFAVGKFPHIHRFLTGLFMSARTFSAWKDKGYPLTSVALSDDQLLHLVSWLAHFYQNAARQALHPSCGTVLILAGPAGAGKSFFGHELLGQLMGGVTEADQYYISGQRFTSDLVKHPVHLIDDKLGSRNQRERLKFTEALKVTVANGRIRYEAKFGSAIEGLPWPGRIVILSNEDAQSLSVLPDLDMSTRDKFMMLRLGTARFPFGSTDENQTWLAEELPYFARFLLGWRIPVSMRDPRFGVKAIQHADMAQASAENGMTQVLVQILEACIDNVTGSRDPVDPSDARGYAVEGNAVVIYRWIANQDPSYARDIIDSRELQKNLSTIFKSGGYNLEYDEPLRRWKIPYNFRKIQLTPTAEI